MKKILKALCAFTVLFALAACTEKDNNEQTQNNGNNNGNGGGNYSSLILGTYAQQMINQSTIPVLTVRPKDVQTTNANY